MDYIDNQIKEQIKQLEKLQSYKTELQEKNKSQEVNIEANINEIQKQVDDYKLYKELKEEFGPQRVHTPEKYDRNKDIHYQEMDKIRREERLTQNMCNNNYQLLLSQTILEIYKILNK
jgi:hypothetical protein